MAEAQTGGQAHAAETFRTQYHLGPGDKIQINVDGEKDLSMEITVSPHGFISYTFLGEISVTGSTIKELETLIRNRLSDGYLRNPRVYVSIVEYRIYFVNGEVRKSGGFPYRPGLTVRKAIVLAGGFSERANQDGITVIRGNDASYTERPIGLNDPLFPGDIITVTEGFW
ncbi:MAG: polysaccharide export protein [Magnetococcales bacterium]|nr:polysaccharide export protein [Magnetococcales bacterium]